MPSRSRQTFAKRQKEMARKEKQERKAQKRLDRKRDKAERRDEVPVEGEAAAPPPEP